MSKGPVEKAGKENKVRECVGTWEIVALAECKACQHFVDNVCGWEPEVEEKEFQETE